MLNKKVLIAAVVLLMVAAPGVLGAVGHVAAQDDTSQRTITVTGYGIAYGAPDIVRVGLGVDASNTDILAAMDESSNRMNAVMQALQNAGVAAEDIRTEYFSIYQDYSMSSGPVAEGQQPSPTYRVSNTVSVTVRDTSNVAELLAAAVAAGANVVNYVQFDIADRSSLESEARNQAITDAQDRAQQIATSLGLTVGEPLRVVEENAMNIPIAGLGGGGGMGAAASAPPISQGQLSVNMAVTITFAVQ